MNYLIIDTTANTNEIFVDVDGENSSVEKNSMVFKSEFKAKEFINENNWNSWAKTKETNLPVNQ